VAVIVLQLRLMLTSLQRNLEELLETVAPAQAVATASALSQARAKLRHTAFVELNEFCVSRFYRDSPVVRRWRGYLVTAVDGSTVALPRTPELAEAFGGMKPHQGDFRPKARILERCDVLNDLSLWAVIAPYKLGERTLLKAQLAWDIEAATGVPASQCITLYDRGFAGFALLRHHVESGSPFVLRLPAKWWHLARNFLASGEMEREFCFKAGKSEYRLRLVRVETDDPAQPAVLVTNLLDREALPADSFRELYALRWGVESHYKVLKCRAELENWSAKTEEGIRQDFYAKVMTLSLTAALSAGADEQLRTQSSRQVHSKQRKHPVRVNRTHALAAVCRHLPKLLWKGLEQLFLATLKTLNACFLRAACLIRPNRSNPRPAARKRMPPTAYKHM
jgi:hypothetical protein